MSTDRIIIVEIVRHRDSGLLLGKSEQMRGLYVHARSIEELERRIPLAIKEMLEATGEKNVQVLPFEDEIPEAFVASGETRKFALAA
ncbi:hypothetical protein FF80_02887 [Devosia sp. LC5]|uniref:DUF1902 domain-containing protein n=1 Tax=Devosia sp. LC5 TaxID=1502724 RepID=UPI0004E3A349|nr:DUF1902 domain-containing protein [Devosia sp. LC5]KFC65037.1 hypothetical protein FF80_02887 [Devosia sp. LC5]